MMTTKHVCETCGGRGVFNENDNVATPCNCVFDEGISASIWSHDIAVLTGHKDAGSFPGGDVNIKFVEGGGTILEVRDTGGCDGAPPYRLRFVVDTRDLDNVIEVLQKAKKIKRFLGQA